MTVVVTSNGTEAEALLTELLAAEADTANLRDQLKVIPGRGALRRRRLHCAVPLAAGLW